MWGVPLFEKRVTMLFCSFCNRLWLFNALCAGYSLVKMEISDSSQISTTAPILSGYNYFRKDIWRLASVQFNFWYIFGTSWSQSTADGWFTISSVSIQAGCREDVNKILGTSWTLAAKQHIKYLRRWTNNGKYLHISNCIFTIQFFLL